MRLARIVPVTALAAAGAATPTVGQAAQTPCDRAALPTIAENAAWRIVEQGDPKVGTVAWACDRHAASRLRVRSLAPAAPAGVTRAWVASQTVELRGDLALVATTSYLGNEERTRRRVVNLANGTALPALPDSYSSGSSDARTFQRVTTAFTAPGAIAWATYAGTGKDTGKFTTAVDSFEAAGPAHLPLDATLVTGPPTGSTVYVRMPDLSVRRLELGGRAARVLFTDAPPLRWRSLPKTPTQRAAWPHTRDLAWITGVTSEPRWQLRSRQDGTAAIVRTNPGAPTAKLVRRPIRRGTAAKLQLLAADRGALIVRGWFPGAKGERLRVYEFDARTPALDITTADLTAGPTPATVANDGDWAVSTRYGVLMSDARSTRNVGHAGATDLAQVTTIGWALYLTDAGQPFRIPSQ